MTTISRRAAATAVATAATAGLAVLTIGAPAQASTTMTGPDGHATILLSDQDVHELSATDTIDPEIACSRITADVMAQRFDVSAGRGLSIPMCLDITAACIAQVGTHPQINLFPNNTYTCTQYSTDGSLFVWLAQQLIP